MKAPVCLQVLWTSRLVQRQTFLTRPILSRSQPLLPKVVSAGATCLNFSKTSTLDHESCFSRIVLFVSKWSPTCTSLWVRTPFPILSYTTTSPHDGFLLLAWVLLATSTAFPLLHPLFRLTAAPSSAHERPARRLPPEPSVPAASSRSLIARPVGSKRFGGLRESGPSSSLPLPFISEYLLRLLK